MKNKKETKKPYKSLPSNIIWSFSHQLRYAPSSFILLALCVPLNIAMTYAGIYLPSLVVSEVTNGSSLEHAVIVVGGLLLVMLLGGILTDTFSRLADSRIGIYRHKVTIEVWKKALGCPYQLFESKKMRDLQNRASRATEMWDGVQPLTNLPEKTLRLTEAVISYFLFGTVLTFVSPWLTSVTGNMAASVSLFTESDKAAISQAVEEGLLDREFMNADMFVACTNFKDVKWYILRVNGEIAGYLRAECGYANIYDIGWLYVEPRFRGHGYAACLVVYFSKDMFANHAIPHYGYAISHASVRVAEKCGFMRDPVQCECRCLKPL